MSDDAAPDRSHREDGGTDAPPRDGYVETREPPVPEAAYAVINFLVTLVLRSPLHGVLSDSLLLLSFAGRRSGTEYTTPVGYWVRDGRLVITTHSPWWHNFEAPRRVEVLLAGQWREGVATARSDPETVAAYVEEFIDRRGLDAARRLGVTVDGDREPTVEELGAGVEGTVVVEVELTDGGPPP